MTFHALPRLPLTHDRTPDDLSRTPDHSFVRAKFKRGRDRCNRAYRGTARFAPPGSATLGDQVVANDRHRGSLCADVARPLDALPLAAVKSGDRPVADLGQRVPGRLREPPIWAPASLGLALGSGPNG
jgi:hypothetical protein